MQIEITGVHVDLTDAIRRHVEEKFKFVNNYHNVTKMHVILSIEKDRQKADTLLHVSNFPENVTANAETDNMYASIDLLVDKIEKQLIKVKEKSLDAHRQPKERQYEP